MIQGWGINDGKAVKCDVGGAFEGEPITVLSTIPQEHEKCTLFFSLCQHTTMSSRNCFNS